ncbi:akirin-2 [Tachysurus fulvidraco]|uniref:akirin-2 n=1 Tax=Tachysurus fulvidraco TaxID=1234273 RepID=UPI000F4FC56A|nr:akirin-2 [Tachysurus fulvidraco]
MACGATLKRSLEFDPVMKQNSPKRRRCAPLSPSSSSSSSSSPRKYLRLEPSPFSRMNSTPTPEQILHNIKQEYKRMKRRHLDNSLTESTNDSQPSTSITSVCVGSLSPSKKEQPLFSLKQVGLICERLLKEQEEKVREEFEETLTAKLAEQYDMFVKFTHDQLMRRFGEQPASYVS